MKISFRPVVAALSLAAATLLASNCYAQNIAPLFNAAGSSGAFNAFALAARISNGSSGVCGDHNWTLKSGAAGHDNRGDSSISDVTANVWIVWNDTPEPNRTVCAYLAVDSIVGQRLFFGSPQGSLNIPSSDIGLPGGNIVPLLPADEALPSNIYNDLQGKVFNAAPSDIRSEDAEFGTTRAISPLNAQLTGLGYGPSPVGATILSAFSSKSAQVVAYNISGNDPITTQPVVSPTAQTNVGAQAVMIGVNSTNTGVGHLGNAAFNNVDRFVAAGVFSGVLTRTRDLIPSSGLPDVPLTILHREPLSGTFNTFEFTVVRSVETNAGYVPASQELGVGGTANNPLNITLPDGATRKRVIGTGEMVSELGLNPDSIGYAFWSFGNWAPDVTTARYLTIDGVDPLNATYSGGTFPTCTAPCPGVVTFPHIIDGSYPAWNILRVTTKKPVPAGISSLISAAQIQVANIPDFVAESSLLVFRSHYKQSGINPKNGHKGNHIEAGGDVGGAVFTTQADLDYITDTGIELTGYKE
jgi:ABC-type phosphate transport system substrate-binding protein